MDRAIIRIGQVIYICICIGIIVTLLMANLIPLVELIRFTLIVLLILMLPFFILTLNWKPDDNEFIWHNENNGV
ncbi:hypothetical protein [Vallitalea okinawensis]|uniref:hypothetical protein n=1 Tax=Vallitalea okinawensis TaxID=2078660 RepID=UPI000CFB5517|nr:hypothetical protein [Vallitalea okinawensis]